MTDRPAGKLQSLLQSGEQAFRARYQRPPELVAAAPGRVNLIGEHTDYNGGFVFPMAIDRHVVLLAARAPAEPPRLRIWTSALEQEAVLPLPDGQGPDALALTLRHALDGPGGRPWARYLAGVVAELAEERGRDWRPPALDVLVESDVPLGGGLSSSAALEVALATLLEAATGIRLPQLAKAEICQRAEQRWAGVPCGIMDQLTAVAAAAGSALLIDCQARAWQAVPLPAQMAVLVTSSQVSHALDDGTYAARASECAQAAAVLGVSNLRQATPEALAASQDRLSPELYRRARHVLTENHRTLAAAQALRAGDLATLGSLLYEGHRSLRDDFEVSCRELDALVEAAAEIGEAGGVLGARLTGGGFGGSTITLVRSERAAEAGAALAAGFARRTGLHTSPFVASAVAGARMLQGWAAAVRS